MPTPATDTTHTYLVRTLPRGMGGAGGGGGAVKSPIHFHCVLYANKQTNKKKGGGGGGPDSR